MRWASCYRSSFFKVIALKHLRPCKASLGLILEFDLPPAVSDSASFWKFLADSSSLLRCFLSAQYYPEMPVTFGVPQVLVNVRICYYSILLSLHLVQIHECVNGGHAICRDFTLSSLVGLVSFKCSGLP